MSNLNFTDGIKTKEDDYGIVKLFSPLDFSLKKEMKKVIKLGLSCERPLLIFQSAGTKMRGIKLSNLPFVFDKNEEVFVEIINDSDNEIFFEARELLAKAVIL